MSLPITTFSSTEAPLSTADVIAGARQLGASGGGPGTARLLAVLIDPLAELDEVLSTLHGEPALAARVLKVANAPLYGRSGQVGTLEHAVQMLGLDAVRGICAACCMDRTPIAGNPGGLDPRQFRLHSLAAAFAGLLHDIGLVLMARLRPQTLAALADQQPPADAEAEIAFERQHAGLSHDACAGHLAAAWGLPVWLIEAVGAHHAFPCSTDPLEPPALTLARLVQAADALAHHAGFGLRASCAQALAWPQLGLGADDALIDSIVAALPDQIGAVMDAGP
jgi:HD-like signal output (HDOD) protein